MNDKENVRVITNQAEWIHKYNDETREVFNQDLFARDNYEVIEALKSGILSCQRNRYFTIRVDKFTVVEDYTQIHKILYDYEQKKINKNKNNSKKMENPYDYINLRDSDVILLIVDYFISINIPERLAQDTLQVIIQVPRIVDKYYYRINGNYFSAIYQIVDGSTYNNTSSNSKRQSVTFKTIFIPTVIYRNTGELTPINADTVKYVFYIARIFDKNVPVLEYFFAKFGLYRTFLFLGIYGAIIVRDDMNPLPDEEMKDKYCFSYKGFNIYAPQMIYDQDLIVQCTVATLIKHISNAKLFNVEENTLEDLLDTDHWLTSLAERFNSKPSIEKGYSILDSLEAMYDQDSHKTLRLPEEDKADIYCVLRWLIREFPQLRLKDNADISAKKIRRAGYIASIYTARISDGIYRASDNYKKLTIEELKKCIRIDPSYLINQIVKDKLVSFRDNVNDNDAFTALKFSFKGRSGLGENDNSTIPDSYRQLHPSNLTRTDPDTSSATDPGLTGIICPMAKIYNGSFAPKEYQEPNDWQETFDKLMDQYYSTVAKKQLIEFQDQCDDVFEETPKEEVDILDYCLEQQKKTLQMMGETDNTTQYVPASETENGKFIIWDVEE